MRFLYGFSGVVAFGVYIATLAPTITWRNEGADSGDLAAAVAVNGVPHPPGYPTYLLLAKLFGLLPVGDMAYRLNLLSATCAALTVVLVGLIIGHTLTAATPPANSATAKHAEAWFVWCCATSAALSLAFSPLFWSQAVIAEVYALNVFLAALLIYGSLRITPVNEQWLIPALAMLLGLSLGNHLSIVLFLPLIFAVLRPSRCFWSLFRRSAMALSLGLLVYLIIPLRAAASPPVNWGGAVNMENFWWLVSASLYRGYLFDLPPEFLTTRIGSGIQLFSAAFLWWGLPVGLLGLYRLFAHHRPLASGSLITLLLTAGYAMGYNTSDSYVYLLPALLIFALWLGWGLFELGQALQDWLNQKFKGGLLIGWLIVSLPLAPLMLNFSTQDLSQDFEALNYATHSLKLAAPGAIIITEDDSHTFALWYARYALATRPDVSLVNLNLLPYDWYRQTLASNHPNLRLMTQHGVPVLTMSDLINENLATRAIYLANVDYTPPTAYQLTSFSSLQQIVFKPNPDQVHKQGE